MTKVLLITNVVVGLLVIADMLYGKYMGKKLMSEVCECSMEVDEEINASYCELEMRDAELEERVCALEELCKKSKRTSTKKSTKKK